MDLKGLYELYDMGMITKYTLVMKMFPPMPLPNQMCDGELDIDDSETEDKER